MATWIEDTNGNKCSVEFWGSEEKAKHALSTLVRCSDCFDCSRCSGCSDCFDRSGVINVGVESKIESAIEVPVIADLHKKLYAAVTQPNALDMSDWHTCETTHCRAGWVVTLAGEEGKKLDNKFDTLLAAMKIYDASCPGFEINPCRFFDSKENALADMKKLAEA